MIEKSDEGDKQFSEEVVRAFSLLKASKAQFICHPEKLELQGDQKLTGTLTLQSAMVTDMRMAVKAKTNSPPIHYTFRVDRQWRLQQLQDCGNSIGLASLIAQDGKISAKESLTELRKGLSRIDCPVPSTLAGMMNSDFGKMFNPLLPKDCLANMFVHSKDIVISLYFIQTTSKNAHPPIKRLFYPKGTVFDFNGHRLEVTQAIHSRTPIQWLQAARTSSLQAAELLNIVSRR